MKRILLFIFLLISQYNSSAQCNYVWANWTNTGLNDTAVGTILVNGAPITMTMAANFQFDFTPTIFGYPTFSPFPYLPVNSTAPRTTWAIGPGGQTSMCFSQPVQNPILLLASLGSPGVPITLTFSNPYGVLFDGGGNTFTNTTTLDAEEGFCIIEFPGTFTCVTIYSSTPEFYANLAWGITNPLSAGFTFANQCVNNSVSFSSATSTINPPATIISYDWTFGDGTVSSAQNPTHAYSTPGAYQVRLVVTSSNLCTDTLLQLITVYPEFNTTNPVSICSGQSYTFNSHTYSNTGTYYDTLSTIWGCDSVITTLLHITAVVSSVNPQTICSGTSYFINSHSYSQSGNYYDTLSTPAGCDSIVNTQLNVLPANILMNPQTICSGDNYIFNSHIYSSTGNYYDTLTSVTGCDSIIETQLTVNPTLVANNPQSICPGGSYLFNSHTFTVAGVYYDTLQTTVGCDSIVVTTLSINIPPVITFTHPPDICIDADPLALNFASPGGGLYSGTGVLNNTFDPNIASVGTHQIIYAVIDPATSCMNTANENITVHPSPVAKLAVTPNFAFLSDAKISFSDLTTGTISSEWDFGDGSATTVGSGMHLYNDTGHYQISLTVTDHFGCSDTIEVTVFIEAEFAFYVPNVFTPNGDGINDNFSGSGMGFHEYSMLIYDRWGKQVFSTDNINKTWSGKDVQGDTYVYKINLMDPYGKPHEYVGRVSVVR